MEKSIIVHHEHNILLTMREKIAYFLVLGSGSLDTHAILTGHNITIALGIIVSIITIPVMISTWRRNRSQRKLAEMKMKEYESHIDEELEND